MVMEASPSPQSVGREFVRQYYTLLNKAPAHLHRFYNNHSSFVHGGLDAPNRETLPVVGQKQIHNRIQQLNFRDCHAKISQVDSQATLGSGVVVQVTGELSNGGAPMRRFTQTFVLAAQSPKKYYVHNDIFRYQDIVFSDEEGSASGRSEGEEEEPAAGYFPPAPPAFPPPPAPPLVPALPAPPAPAAAPDAPHLNGHPPPQDDARQLVAALQAAAVSSLSAQSAPLSGAVGVEAEPEAAPAPASPVPDPAPEPEREPSPPPQPLLPPAAPEPKTYANLLKSGAGQHAPPRGSPPAPAPAPASYAPASYAPASYAPASYAPASYAPASYVPAPALPPAPTSGPAQHESRPRPPRALRDIPPPTVEGPSAGAAGVAGVAGAGAGPGARRYSDAQQLFLGNLPHAATEDELRALFARFGPVAELRVHGKAAAPGAPRHPNYGFITYESEHSARACLLAAPLYFPGEGADAVKLNVEEKKARGREPPRRRPHSGQRAFRQPYRR